MQPASLDRQISTGVYAPGEYLAHEGEKRHVVLRLEAGWAYRYRSLVDGRRQITALFLPGDYCEPQWLLESVVRQPVIAVSKVRARLLPIADLYARMAGPDTVQTVLGAALASLDKQAEWLVSLGRRTAIERIAVLLCDMFDRMRAAGLVQLNQCAMPLTQADLADLSGLTAVHVNRVLRQLRARGLADIRAKWLKVPDRAALLQLATPAAA